MSEIRTEAPPDEAAVRVLYELAFSPSEAEGRLVDALRTAGDSVAELCLVAEGDDGDVVGHIMYSRAALDTGPALLALAPMAVVPERHREGIGLALVRESLRRAASLPARAVVVLGHPGFYSRAGFEPAAPLGITAPFTVPAEAWMACRLPAWQGDERGTVVYPRAFADVA